MTKRSKYARIPADEVTDPKSWHLPYWVEPNHLVQQEEEEVLVEEEEIEVEPLTAEQLEQIRQAAYNEGLEQGLVEGRQKGEKLGFDQGHKDGFAAGKKEGTAEGQIQGKDKGEAQALSEGKARTDQKVNELQAVMQALIQPIDDQIANIETLLPKLVIQLAEHVVAIELNQGSEHIVHLCHQAVSSLPVGAKNIKVFVSNSDLPFLEAAIEQQALEYTVLEDATIQPGGCRVESDESLVDFTLSSRWSMLLKQYEDQFKLGDLKTTLDPDLGEMPEAPAITTEPTQDESHVVPDIENTEENEPKSETDTSSEAITLDSESNMETDDLVDDTAEATVEASDEIAENVSSSDSTNEETNHGLGLSDDELGQGSIEVDPESLSSPEIESGDASSQKDDDHEDDSDPKLAE